MLREVSKSYVECFKVNLGKLVKWSNPAKFTSASSPYHQLKPWHCVALSLTLPSDLDYLPTYHLTLSRTDQHLVLVSEREVDKNGRASHLIHHHLQQQERVMLNHLGGGWPLSNWGLNSTFTHSFISSWSPSRACYMSGRPDMERAQYFCLHAYLTIMMVYIH